MNNSKKAYIYLGIGIILWASTPAVAKLLLRNLDNFQVLFFTSLIATITLFLICIFQNKLKIILNYKAKDYFTFIYTGFFGIFLYYLLTFASLSLIPAQESSIVNYLWPIMVLILATLILKERMSIKKILAIIISFVGVWVVVSKGNLFNLNFSNSYGVLFAFLGAISYGLFSVLGKKQNYEKITSMFFYYLFSFILILIIAPFFTNIKFPTLMEFMGLLWLGIFTSGIAYVLWFLALKYGETTKMSNLIYLTPFVSLIYIYLLTGEKILYSSIIGLIIVILGIILQLINFPKKSK